MTGQSWEGETPLLTYNMPPASGTLLRRRFSGELPFQHCLARTAPVPPLRVHHSPPPPPARLAIGGSRCRCTSGRCRGLAPAKAQGEAESQARGTREPTEKRLPPCPQSRSAGPVNPRSRPARCRRPSPGPALLFALQGGWRLAPCPLHPTWHLAQAEGAGRQIQR